MREPFIYFHKDADNIRKSTWTTNTSHLENGIVGLRGAGVPNILTLNATNKVR